MMRTPTTRIQVWMVLLVVSAVLTTTGAFPGPHQDASGSSRSSSLPSSSSEATGHKILEEEVVYSRWRIFLRRLVQMPNDKVVDFDVSQFELYKCSCQHLGRPTKSLLSKEQRTDCCISHECLCLIVVILLDRIETIPHTIGYCSKGQWRCHHLCLELHLQDGHLVS